MDWTDLVEGLEGIFGDSFVEFHTTNESYIFTIDHVPSLEQAEAQFIGVLEEKGYAYLSETYRFTKNRPGHPYCSFNVRRDHQELHIAFDWSPRVPRISGSLTIANLHSRFA